MFFYEGYTCPVCEKPFCEQDDIVACPLCGAPHHRTCWQQEGQCHFADRHGTPEQWSRQEVESASDSAPEKRVCPRCGHHNPADASLCSHCGKPLCESEPPLPNSAVSESSAPESTVPPAGTAGAFGSYREYSPYHLTPEEPANDIPAEEKMEDVTARDMASAVGSNVAYYLPRFRRISREGKVVSWNGAAFLFTSYWLFYRKNYLAGTLVFLLETFMAALTVFFQYKVLIPLLGGVSLSSPEAINAMMQGLSNGSLLQPMLTLYLLSFVTILLHIFLGLFGNRLYYRTCLNRVRKFRQEKPDGYPAELSAQGGASFILGVIAYITQEFIGYVLLSLFL